MKLVLASKSPRRIELLKKMGIDFICHPANIDEDIQLPNTSPELFTLFLAKKKAASVGDLYPENLVLGIDTVVSIDKRIIGKPKNMTEAQETLLTLSGRTHKVISGVCLMRKSDSTLETFTETSLVQFKKIDKTVIQKYYSLVNPLDKAGGYAIQEHGNMIIEKIEGSKNNIIGLPTEKLMEFLKLLVY